MFRFASRSISRASALSPRCLKSKLSPFNTANFNVAFKRTYASQTEGGDIIADFTQKVKNNPTVGEAIIKVQKLLHEKGIDTSSGELSPMQYVKIFSDKEIRESFETLSVEMKKADIKFSKDQIESLMKVLGLEK